MASAPKIHAYRIEACSGVSTDVAESHRRQGQRGSECGRLGTTSRWREDVTCKHCLRRLSLASN